MNKIQHKHSEYLVKNILFAFGYKQNSAYPIKDKFSFSKTFNFLKSFFKKSVKPLAPPRLKQVQVIEYLVFDDMNFFRNYSVVQVRDSKNEIRNVYEIQLRYMNQGVYLLEENVK